MKRSDIYKAIRDKLLSDIPGLTVDVNRGQMDSPKADYPIPVPVALVNLYSIRWEIYAHNLERGLVTVQVDFYKVICSGTFSGAEAENETLDLLDSPDEIYQSLKYLSLPEGSLDELVRTRESEIRSSGRLIGYRIEFEGYVYQEITM